MTPPSRVITLNWLFSNRTLGGVINPRVQGGCFIWQQVGFCCQRHGTWVTLLSLATEPQGMFRKGWTFFRASRIKWGQRQCIGLVTNWALLGTTSFPKTFANIFALQTGIKDFKFTNDTRRAENISRKYWFKSSWSLSGIAVINYSL